MRKAASGASILSLMLLGLTALSGTSRGANRDNSEAAAFFESKVRPVLLEHCTACHGEKLQKGGLRLDSRFAALQGGGRGKTIIPGDPDKSPLIKAVLYTGPLKMPPTGALSSTEIAALTTWVKNGAVWPADRSSAPIGEKTADQRPTPDTRPSTSAARHWSFLPVKLPAPPRVKNAAWVCNPIDAFVLAGLEAKVLTPAAPADRRTLIRRASFDLTGLPPTPEEVGAFVSDKSPGAWEKVVDRLLASPRYGERWGRHWLDVARYADSLDARGVGGEGDISEAWRYRDWVINAFNHDMPYNQFIMNQIAGDLLPATDAQGNASDVNINGTIATGLLAIGNWGNGDADKDKILTDIADDQVDIVSRGFLGLTIGCARCHDHKFDPITTKDYYGLAGIFFSSHILPKLTPKGAGENILRIPLETKAQREQRAQYAARTAELEKRQKAVSETAYQSYAKAQIPETAHYLTAVWDYQHRSADQSDVSLADFALKRGLKPYAMRQWRDFLGMGDAYRLLAQQARNVAGHTGVFAWQQETGTPNLTVNTTDQALQILTFTLPPHSVNVHPGPAAGVAVEWVSPIAGAIQVTGSVKDADPACGNGVAWVVALRQRSGVIELASGEFANGGEQNFAKGKNAANLNAITVRPGDKIEVQVLPNGEYSCDTTTVDFVVKQTNGAQVWNLTADMLEDPLKANPRSDRFGHADVWRFTDMANSGAKPYSGLALAPALTKWRETVMNCEADTARTPEALQQQKAKIEAAAKEFQQAFTLTDKESPFYLPSPQEESLLPEQTRAELTKIATQLDTLRKNPPPPITYANGAQEGGVPESPHAGVHDVHVHIRGSYARLGDLVPRHFPVVLAGDNQPPITQGSGRLELARWIASDTNPLTARVMVNRIWQHHFGQGIVRTPSNFGALGERPTNPALLDYLAAEFVKSGWSMKAIHRLIMLSQTYRQSSIAPAKSLQMDADNRLFGRMNRQRLEAESLRDNLLSVSGTLDTTMGGVAYRDFNVPRRTVYLMTIRSDRSGFGPLFDLADSTATADHRTISNVAPQALFLMNNPFALQQTKILSKRLQESAKDDAERIQTAYRLLYSRPPAATETRIGLAFLNRVRGGIQAAASEDADKGAWEAYCQILLCANEFMYVD